MSAFQIKMPSRGLVLLDSLGITTSINKFYLGEISFELLMNKYEILYQKRQIQPPALLSIYLICGWNLFDILPTTHEGFSIKELKIKSWLNELAKNKNRFKEVTFSLARLTTYFNFENDFKNYSQNVFKQLSIIEHFNKPIVRLLIKLISTLDYNLTIIQSDLDKKNISNLRDALELVKEIVEKYCVKKYNK